MKRVLVTGANGFIGRHSLHALAQRGFDVHAVTREPQPETDTLHWHEADLFDSAATAALVADVRATHLLHLAWITEPGEYWQSPENRAWLEAGKRLLDEFQGTGGARAVITGTCAEYDWSNGHCVEDETPCRARSPYTEAKLALRDYARGLAANSALSVAWARVFYTFGPFEHPDRLVPSIILPLLRGQRAQCTDAAQVRDYLYVADVADALNAVLDHDYSGDINIASGHAPALRDIIVRIGKRLEAQERIDFGARARAPDEPPSITADTSRLNDIVGWRPRYTIDSAIDETIAWWQDNDFSNTE